MAKPNKRIRKLMKSKSFRKSLSRGSKKKRPWLVVVLLLLLLIYLYSIGTNMWVLILVAILIVLALK